MSGVDIRSREMPPGAADVSVTPVGERWVVAKAGAARRSGVYATQAEAVRAAQALTRAKGGHLVVHERDGCVSESFTLGRLAFEKISAVEGIRLSRTMKRDLRRVESDAPEAARRTLLAKYGKTSD